MAPDAPRLGRALTLALLLVARVARAEPHPHDAPPDSSAAEPMPGMHHHDMAGMDMSDMHAAMHGMYGPYPMTREASGTAWQPDAARSEERRVGKECRSWWSAEHEKKNRT